jgi:hypothetical protein
MMMMLLVDAREVTEAEADNRLELRVVWGRRALISIHHAARNTLRSAPTFLRHRRHSMALLDQP